MMAVAALSVAAQAQVSIIPKVGISLSNINFDEDKSGQKSNLGLVAGAGLNIPITSDGFFSIQPELYYIQKGTRFNYGNEDTKFYHNHVELPLLLKVNFGTEAVKLYVNAGPSFGYFLGGKIKRDNNTYKIEFNERDIALPFEPGLPALVDAGALSGDITYGKEQTNRLDIGLQFGGGVGFDAGPGAVLLDARYGFGLTDLSDFNSSSDAVNKSKNNVFLKIMYFSLHWDMPFLLAVNNVISLIYCSKASGPCRKLYFWRLPEWNTPLKSGNGRSRMLRDASERSELAAVCRRTGCRCGGKTVYYY